MNTVKSEPKNTIVTGVIYKQILAFFFPILLGSFFQQLYSTADAVIVGRFATKEGLAAIGATTYPVNTLIGFFIGLSSGASVIISQLFGSGKYKDLKKAVGTAIALSVLCGILVSVIGILVTPATLRAMNTPEDIFSSAVLYMRVFFTGSVVVLIYNVGAGILMAVGDSKSPLYVLIVCTFVNIILDFLFVAVMKTGVFGAALATLLSQLVSAVLILLILMRTELDYKLDLKKVGLHKDLLFKMLKIGLPTGLQATLYTVSNMIIQSRINDFGTDTVAAWTALTRIDNLFWMVLGAFGISITTFVGQNFGAGKFDRVKKGVRVTLWFTGISSAFLSIVSYLFCGPLLGIFTSDSAVITIGVNMCRHYCQYYLLFIAIEILSGAVRGTGDSFLPTVITAVGICLLRVLWIFFAVPMNPSVEIVIACYPLTWFITSAVFILYYLHGGWLKRRKAAMGFQEETA